MKTIEEFIEALSLECVFKMTAPHIQAAVRQLHCKNVRKAVEEIDNYVIHRELATNKIWKRNYPLQSQWHNNRQNYSQQPSGTSKSSIQQQFEMPQNSVDQVQKSGDSKPAQDQSMSTSSGLKSVTQIKRPHRLAKYFDSEKGAMCFKCKKWGHLAAECTEPQIYRIETHHSWAS